MDVPPPAHQSFSHMQTPSQMTNCSLVMDWHPRNCAPNHCPLVFPLTYTSHKVTFVTSCLWLICVQFCLFHLFMHTVCVQTNFGGVRPSLVASFYLGALSHIRSAYPFWNKSGGRDHIWVGVPHCTVNGGPAVDSHLTSDGAPSPLSHGVRLGLLRFPGVSAPKRTGRPGSQGAGGSDAALLSHAPTALLHCPRPFSAHSLAPF